MSKNTKGSKLLYVSLKISPKDTEQLKEHVTKTLELSGIQFKYPVMRNKDDPAHITLCYFSDFKKHEDFMSFTEKYNDVSECSAKIVSMAVDKHCVALCVESVNGSDNSPIQYYPENKNLHITMMLNDKKPVYSNILIKGLKEQIKEKECPDSNSNMITFEKPLMIKCTLEKVY
jgi:hypothetical protein